ncbi:MAG: 1,4-beta-glucanase [Ruminococcus sp.]|nr:1,4-beta-glucanase [Ruminococcus sp.]
MKHRTHKGLLAVCTAAALSLSASVSVMPMTAMAATTDATNTMTWDAVRIGGGGFVSGIVTGKDVMYVRTDVGGAYKYNFKTNEWEQLFAFLNEAERGYLSVDAMAIDPTDDNTVYFLCGCAYFSGAGTRIYKTTDGGKTFTYTDVTDLIQVHGNGYGRQCGEAIAVDPDNPDVIYCGGDVAYNSSGLIKSTDGGKTWKSVEGYSELGFFSSSTKWPTWTDRICKSNDSGEYMNQNGVGTVMVTGGKVYVGTSATGAGNFAVADTSKDTFTTLSSKLPTDVYPSHITLDANGDLLISYIAGLTFAAGAGGVYRYDPDTDTVTDISPVNNSIGCTVSDPDDANKLVATTCAVWSGQSWDSSSTCYGEWMYRSEDGGQTWTSIYPGKKDGIWVWDEELGEMHDNLLYQYTQTGGYDWIYGKAIHWSGAIALNPRDPDQLWTVSGNGVFRWDNMWGQGYEDSPVATFHPTGIEEVVALDMCSVPGGNVYSAIGDYDGFVHTNPDQYCQQHVPNMGSTGAIAYCPQNPDVMVRIAEKQNDVASGFYTLDGGKTWTKMSCSYGGKAAITQLKDGSYRIFQSSGDNSTAVSYSDDFGASWNNCSGIPTAYGSKTTYMLVEPDQPNIVYAYATYFNSSWHYSKPEPTAEDAQYKLCVSTDYGATFTPTDICMYDQCDSAGRIAYLGEGELILGGGWYGMYHASVASNGSVSVKKLDSVFYCKTVGYGAPKEAGDVNALYMYGMPTEDDPEGIYRSDDGGESWVCINTDHLYGGTGNGNFLVGDMNTYGTVYMSTVGCGIIYGTLGSSTGNQNPGDDPDDPPVGNSDLGDVNCSGNVEIADVILLNRILAEDTTAVFTAQGLKNAEVTGDTDMNSDDAIRILMYLAGLATLG